MDLDDLRENIGPILGVVAGIAVAGVLVYNMWPRSVEDKTMQKRDNTYVAHFGSAQGGRSSSIDFRFEDEQTYEVFKRLINDIEYSTGGRLTQDDWYSILTKIDDPKYAGMNTISKEEMSAAWARYQKEGAEQMYRRQK